ncbi:hypothetical protein [Rhodanobacter lindaniclasticus]
MPVADSSLQLWLPSLAHIEPAHPLRAWLPRADRLPDGGIGYLGGLGDHFHGVDAGVPAAAITREFLAGDAGGALWLSADPAWVQPDMNGVRLLACGRMGLDMDEAQALAEPLRPVFDETGMRLRTFHAGSLAPAFAGRYVAAGFRLRPSRRSAKTSRSTCRERPGRSSAGAYC